VTERRGDGQWTAAWRAGSLRNALWHDNLGRSRIWLATVAPQINHTQNFASALRASTFGPAGLSINTVALWHVGSALPASPFRKASALRASALRFMAISAETLHASPIIRALHGFRGASHAPRNDSDHAECGRVYYTTLSIVEIMAVTGVGTRIGFSYSGPGKSSFVWPRISRPPNKLLRKKLRCRNLLPSFTAWWSLPLLQFAVPPLGGRKGKHFPQNFSKTRRPIVVIFVRWIGLI